MRSTVCIFRVHRSSNSPGEDLAGVPTESVTCRRPVSFGWHSAFDAMALGYLFVRCSLDEQPGGDPRPHTLPADSSTRSLGES